MTKFLCVQHDYSGVSAALFSGQNLIDKVFEDKKRASKYFVTMTKYLLENNDYSLSDLSFIATNVGPGPFTTLRVVLSSVNGIAFATKKPIIGIDALDACFDEHKKGLDCPIIVLLDAFAKDVYFGLYYNDSLGKQIVNKGYNNILAFLNYTKDLLEKPDKIYFIGNGTEKYKEEIESVFGKKAIIDKEIPAFCSIEQVGKMAFDKWSKGQDLSEQVLPIYLKSIDINK